MSSGDFVARIRRRHRLPSGRVLVHLQTSRSRSSVALLALKRYRRDPLGKSMVNLSQLMELKDHGRKQVMRKKHPWMRIVMYQWKLRRTRIKCVASTFLWETENPCQEPRQGSRLSECAYPTILRDFICKRLPRHLQANTIAYQSEPDEDILLGRDILPACDMCHGVRGVARMDEKRWSARFWMILRHYG